MTRFFRRASGSPLLVPLGILIIAALPSDSGVLRAGDLDGIENVFDRPAALAAAEEHLICILDTEHPDVVREKVKQKGVELYKCRALKRRVEGMTGLPCLVVHYSEITWKELANPHIKAILLMAQKCRMNETLQQRLMAFLRENRIPLIGFCGGQQMICEAFGSKVALMRKLNPREPDTNPKYHPGQFKEWGFMPIRIVKSDPILAGFESTFVVKEMHAFEVTQLPNEFDLLASTEACRLQMVKHRERPLYGTQFHPEAYDDEHPDGKQLLKNFFRLSGLRPGIDPPQGQP